jgi:hypothetical protein
MSAENGELREACKYEEFVWRLEDSTPRQIPAHKHYNLMENEDLPFQAQRALINDDMLGYGKTLGRGLGREQAHLRKTNVMSNWRLTTNQAMDGRRHGQGALRFSAMTTTVIQVKDARAAHRGSAEARG